MVVYHISQHDPGVTYHTIHDSTDCISIHGTSKIKPEMVEFSPASKAGTHDIETGPGHYIGYSRWELKRKKFNAPPSDTMRIHRMVPRGLTHL